MRAFARSLLHPIEVPLVPRAKTLPTLLGCSLTLCVALPGLAKESALEPFTATYALEWHGLTAGSSTLTLKQVRPQTYEYLSVNRARGMFRLAFPDPISERSVFTIADGHVRPLYYGEDNGRDRYEQTVMLQFDWQARRVRGTQDAKPVDQPLETGTQDPLSVQIELMRELAAGGLPATFLLFDKDEAKQYHYTRERAETLDTPLGRLDTVVYRSDRPGSDRIMRLWLVPRLGYFPVQAERRRKGKVEFELRIRKLTGGPGN